MGSKEEFDKAKVSADELASSIRDIVFEGRDLTDEVKKLTKGLYGVSERAAQINKTFRDMSRLERDVSIGMVSILDGSRKILDVEKDKVKSQNLSKLLTADLKGLQDEGIRRASDREAIDKRKTLNASKHQLEQKAILAGEEAILKSARDEIDQKLKSKDLSKQQHDAIMSDKNVLKELENSLQQNKIKLDKELIDNLSDQDKITFDKIG